MRAKRQGCAYWAEQIAAADGSGLTTAEYARRQGLSAGQLYRRRLRVPDPLARDEGRVATPTAAAKPCFLAVQIRDATPRDAWQAPASAPIQVFAGAVRFELPALPSPQWVATLSAALTAGRG